MKTVLFLTEVQIIKCECNNDIAVTVLIPGPVTLCMEYPDKTSIETSEIKCDECGKCLKINGKLVDIILGAASL
jgi:hypothetical protein